MEQEIRVEYPSDGHSKQQTFLCSFEVDQEDVYEILNIIWRQFNRIDDTEFISTTESRSSMIGDVYTLFASSKIPQERYFIVNIVGFVEVTANGRDRWLQLHSPTGWRSVDKAFLGSDIIESRLPH